MVLSYNIIIAFVSVLAAYYFCMDQGQFAIYQDIIMWNGILFSAITSLLFIHFRLYSGFWRLSSIIDLERCLQATLFAFAAYVCAFLMADFKYSLSWSILCVQLLLLLCLSLCPRFGLRFVYEKYKSWMVWRAHRGKVCRVLLVGAGEGATMLLRAFKEIEAGGYYAALGILDLKHHNVGRQILGAPILGSLENFDTVMQQLEAEGRKPSKIVLTTALCGQKLLDLQKRAERFNVQIYRTPSLTDFQPTSERGGIDLRPVAVEDLLERPEIKLQENSIEGLIEGRCVLVTGAGGSIGSELCRQIARRSPGSLILVDASEYNLYAISMNIREQFPNLSMVAQLADIRNAPRIQEVFRRHCPELVFHAAALKHVPLCEDNPCESAHTNVIGTRNVAEAALGSGALAFVQVSTDKAVNPTSGGDQAYGRVVLPIARHRPCRQAPSGRRGCSEAPLHYRAFRQRLGLERLSRPALPETITARRAINGHAPGDDALFYEYSGSSGTSVAGVGTSVIRRRKPWPNLGTVPSGKWLEF
jgi:FlaA1/EpsC-like NDP-sugar epimerase